MYLWGRAVDFNFRPALEHLAGLGHDMTVCMKMRGGEHPTARKGPSWGEERAHTTPSLDWTQPILSQPIPTPAASP